MALLGPMVVVAEHSATALVEMLGKAGAFPIVDASWAEAPTRHRRNPAGRAAARGDRACRPIAAAVEAVLKKIETRGGPFMPVLALVDSDGDPAIADALPICARRTAEPAAGAPALGAARALPARHRIAPRERRRHRA